MTRKLRYSERREFAETGSLGPPVEDVTREVLNGIGRVLDEAARSQFAGNSFLWALQRACADHFGWTDVEAERLKIRIEEMNLDQLLDFIELLAEEATRVIDTGDGCNSWPEQALPEAEGRLNGLFERYRFVYRLEGGQVRKIGSPVLDETVIGPALLAVQRPGWGEVEKSFREAIEHQRGGSDENDDALTAANAAVEAALKASGFKGANLGPLAKDFKKSARLPTELKGVPEALEVLLGRSGALRSAHGDAHGKAAGAAAVPQALVDLAIHWAGAFIVYLGEMSDGAHKLS